MTTPVTTLDQRYSDREAVAVGWDETLQILQSAELFWISTVRADGRPHVTPLVAVWADGAVHFHTGAGEQKLANLRANPHVVLTTGWKSESYAMQMIAGLPEEAFIQMGDFVGTAVKHCARRGLQRAIIVGMIGKLSKMADGKMQTHAAGSEVNMSLLAQLASEIGAPAEVCEQIRAANTARHVLEICKAAGVAGLTARICQKVVEHTERHVRGALKVHAFLIDFNGAPLGHYPPDADEAARESGQ